MSMSTPLSVEERAQLWLRYQQGQTIAEAAKAIQRSPAVVGKWWRRFEAHGWCEPPGRGRPLGGALSSFAPAVLTDAVAVKRAHPRWGAARVQVELRQQAADSSVHLPSRSRLAAAFRQRCPEALTVHVPRSAPRQAPPLAHAVHEVWQIDHQEKLVLGDGTVATVCNVRDPFGAAMLASYAFSAKTAKRWRKLTTAEVQTVLRQAFDEWHTLPDSLLTDNELGLAGSPQELFPGRLTLWLHGLGIVHHRIRPHRPTDQAQIERQHRTLDNLTADAASRADLPSFQAALDRERALYNHAFPCRASDCQGQPPVLAHPALGQPRRPYPPDGEFAVFDLQRVFDYLATLVFERRVSSIGVLSVGHTQYYLGRPAASKRVWVRCAPLTREWCIYERAHPADPASETLFAQCLIKNMDAQALTGREPKLVELAQPLQLSLPYLAPSASRK